MCKAIRLPILSCVAVQMLVAQKVQPITFTSKSGWMVRYPSSWHTTSCRNCADPHAANVYVDFSPPHSKLREGWIMIDPLADKPSDVSTDAWLKEMAANANQNKHVHEESFSVNGLPALRVRYKTPQDEPMEAVYVGSALKTVSISFSGVGPGRRLEAIKNYEIFNDVVRSFRMLAVASH